MKIPKRFHLAGIPVNVVENNTMVKEKNMIGAADYSNQLIYLDTTHAPKETTEQAFIHETVHWIFYILGEDELRNNEKLVDQMAHMIYQVIKTVEYSEET